MEKVADLSWNWYRRDGKHLVFDDYGRVCSFAWYLIPSKWLYNNEETKIIHLYDIYETVANFSFLVLRPLCFFVHDTISLSTPNVLDLNSIYVTIYVFNKLLVGFVGFVLLRCLNRSTTLYCWMFCINCLSAALDEPQHQQPTRSCDDVIEDREQTSSSTVSGLRQSKV